MSDDSRRVPVPGPEILWREVNDGAVLVSPEAGQVRVLNEVGRHVWRLMDGRTDIETIVAYISERYAVDSQQVRQDVETFLRDLNLRGMLTWRQ